jgi:hypothetical protein
MPRCPLYFRYWGDSGRETDIAKPTRLTPTETLARPNDSALHAGFRPSEAIVLAAEMPSP